MSNNKPDYTSSLVMVNFNEVVPDTLLQKICSENPAAWGVVVREPSALVIEKYPKIDLTAHYDDVRKIMLGRKKYPTMFCFHDFPSEFDEDEVQPWIPLKDSKGNPLLAVGIEGDFPNYTDTSADHFSEAFKLMHDWLGPKIEDMYKLVGNSPQKLFDFLRSSQFQTDFSNVVGHRGSLAFMPSIGAPFECSLHNELGVASKTWGFATNSYGYTEAVIEAATPAREEPKPVKAAPSASKYAVEEPAMPPTPKVEPPKVVPPPPADPIQKVAAGVIEEIVEMKPPTNFHGKKLKGWYREMENGDLRDDWEQRPAIKVKRTRHVQVEESPKDMIHNVGNTTIVTKGETLPVIGANLQKSAIEFIKKHLGDGSAVIEDPKKAQEEELKLATFTQLMAASGIKSLDDIKRLRTSFLASLTKQHPEASWLLVLQLRARVIELEDQLKDSDKKLGELTGSATTKKPADATGTGASADVHVLAKEELKPTPKKASGGSKYS